METAATNAVSLPFGRYKSRPLWEVPTPYLLWALRESKPRAAFRPAVAAELARRGVAVEAPAPPRVAPPTCPRCGPTPGRLSHRWTRDRLGRRHIKVACLGCGLFLGFARQDDAARALADAAEAERTPPRPRTPAAEAPAFRPFVGYARKRGGPWQVVVPAAASYAECWDLLLAAGEGWQGELLVTQNDPRKARPVPVKLPKRGR